MNVMNGKEVFKFLECGENLLTEERHFNFARSEIE